jgi:hypothetical protein
MPEGIPPNGLPDVSQLAFFSGEDRFFAHRRATIESVVVALRSVAEGRVHAGKCVSKRYTEGLNTLRADEIAETLRTLCQYCWALEQTEGDRATSCTD